MVQIVKLGGSVLTDKGGKPEVRLAELKRLAGEIASAGRDVVVVHGAGSFGHPLAKEAGLAFGLLDDTSATAAARVHADVRRLDLIVLDALQAAGLPAVAFSPFALFGCSDGTPGSWNFVPVRRALELKLVPVTHGDLVLDTIRGVTIVSGDKLIAEMARFLRAERVVFAFDQDGVFSLPPGKPGGKLLERPSRPELEKARAMASMSGAPDVTGGMAAKIEAAKAVLDNGIEVCFVNGLKPGRVAEALAGKAHGTVLLPLKESAP